MDEDVIDNEEQTIDENESANNSSENEDDDEPQFDMSPEDATNLEDGELAPTQFNRKKLLIYICIGLSAVVLIAMISSSGKSKKNTIVEEEQYSQENYSQKEFLASLHNNALYNQAQKERQEEIEKAAREGREPDIQEEAPLIPEVILHRDPPVQPVRNPPPPSGGGGGGSSTPPRRNVDDYYYDESRPDPRRSPITPEIQGGLWSSITSAQTAQLIQPSQSPVSQQYTQINPTSAFSNNNSALQINQNNNTAPTSSFVDSEFDGEFIRDNSIWSGTIIPAILLTAINTDLPGNVLARVTQNVYDSKTGLVLLIPQGSLLIADYNSSISYAQNRVQIIWNTLIRPDGFHVQLEGSPGIDTEGMSGIIAKYSENWFEYVKAAGILTMFSLVNATMTENINKYSNEQDTDNYNPNAAAAAAANAQVMNQLSGSILNRALDIKPTLTINNGELVNVILNKVLYLPPMENPLIKQKFSIKR